MSPPLTRQKTTPSPPRRARDALLRDRLLATPRQNNPYSVNVGLYYVRGRPHVALLFHTVHRYLEAFPETFDQAMINCVLKRFAMPSKALEFLFARDECEADNINYSHPILVRRWRARASSSRPRRRRLGGSCPESRRAPPPSGQRSIATSFSRACPLRSHLREGGGLEVGPRQAGVLLSTRSSLRTHASATRRGRADASRTPPSALISIAPMVTSRASVSWSPTTRGAALALALLSRARRAAARPRRRR